MARFIRTQITLFLCLTLSTFGVNASQGFISIKSAHDVTTTTDNLVSALEAKGMRIFSRIDHAAAANNVGIPLRPTTVLIFGNPKIGSKLMACSQQAAIDLPLKALIYEDESGTTWLGYTQPDYMKQRFEIAGCDKVIEKMTKALSNFSRVATH